MLPNHFIIGAIKAGTTSLASLLRQHPEVFVSNPKELHFFSDPDNFAKGRAWYESHFASAEGKKVVLEATPNYAAMRTYPGALDRLGEMIPDARLIFMVRHPLERIMSHWYFGFGAGWDVPPFNEAVRTRSLFVDPSRYGEQADAMRAKFGAGNLHVIFLDEFKARPDEELARLCRFLRIDPTFQFADADVPRNAMATAGVYRWINKNVPFLHKVRTIIPPRVRRALREGVLKKVERRPEWDAETMRWIIGELAEDSRRFLRSCGKPEDYWRFD